MNLKENISVITSSTNIIKACEFLKITCVVHKAFSLKEIIKERRKVNKELWQITVVIKDDELHYSHTQFSVFCFLLVNLINKKKGKTVFHNFEYIYSKPSFLAILNKNYLSTKWNQLIIKNIYKIPIEVRMSSRNSFMISLDIGYINRISFEVIDDKANYYDLTLKMFKKIFFNSSQITNLFIAQTFSNEAFFKKTAIEKLLPIINNSEISIKNHPKLGSVIGLEKCNKLPDFLPVEMFFQKVTKNVISFHSASLITASQFDDIRTISLLDIVKTDDPFMVSVKEDLITKAKGKILFPQTIEEFKEMLYD